VRATGHVGWTRARIEGPRLVWDVAWSGAVDATDVNVTRPRPGVVRLSCPVPPGRTARITRSSRGLRIWLPARSVSPAKGVTVEFKDADLIYVIKVLAKARGYNVYIGPSVEGEVTASIRSTPPEAALALLLPAGTDYKVVSNGSGGRTFIVAPPDKLAMVPNDIFSGPGDGISVIGCGRPEILFEHVPAAKAMEFLRSRYPNVQFTPHPTMNGFYLNGNREDVLSIKAEVPNLDKVPESPPPPVSKEFVLRYTDPEETRSILETLVPDVQYKLEGRSLTVTGASGAVDQVSELLAEFDFDWPADTAILDCRLVELTPSFRRHLGPVSSAQPSLISQNLMLALVSGAIQAQVLAAPRVSARLGQNEEVIVGDCGLGLRLTILNRRLERKRVKLFLRAEILDRTSQYEVEVPEGETLVWPDLVRAEEFAAIRARPDLAQHPALHTLTSSISTGCGLILMLTPRERP